MFSTAEGPLLHCSYVRVDFEPIHSRPNSRFVIAFCAQPTKADKAVMSCSLVVNSNCFSICIRLQGLRSMMVCGIAYASYHAYCNCLAMGREGGRELTYSALCLWWPNLTRSCLNSINLNADLVDN